MMSRYKYEQVLSSTIDNALLHLWIKVASSKRYISKAARNDILVKWFKPKLKSDKYKIVKNEIRLFLLAGREQTYLLESRLYELHELSREYRNKLSDMHKLNYLVEFLREEHAIDSDLSDGITTYLPNTVYISQKNVEQSFSVDNRQVSPLLVTLFESDVDAFISIVQELGFHRAVKIDETTVSISVLDTCIT